MEVTKSFSLGILSFILILLVACSNDYEYETGEITVMKLLNDQLKKFSDSRILLDTRKVVSRTKIDQANIPVLFVELENGQNGTLTLYPGKGDGETWLGADGTTITLEKGVIKATRGMKNDLMGGMTLFPNWPNIGEKPKYNKKMTYIDGNNQIVSNIYDCQISKSEDTYKLIIFEVVFQTTRYNEICNGKSNDIVNIYYVDKGNVIRKSRQYHSTSLGYLNIERLDR